MASYAESRSTGRELSGQARMISSYDKRIATIEDAIRQREREGRPDAATYRRDELARYKQYKADAEKELAQRRGALGDEAYGQALRDAPKNYRTDQLNRSQFANTPPPNRVNSMYGPGTGQGYTGIKGAPGDPRVAQQQRFAASQQQELASRPGLARGPDGTVSRSSLGDGTFVASQGSLKGKTVTVRSPVASGADGRPIYAPAPRQSYGINLFDANNRDAIRQSGGQYQTAGQLFSSAEPQKTYKQQSPPPISDELRSSRIGDGSNRIAILGNSNQESPRLQALERTSQGVAQYQEASDKRIKNYDTSLSYLSLGKGASFESRSTVGKIGQVGVGLATAPVYGVFAFGDRAGLAATKSFLYTGALITPETSREAKQELKSTLPVLKQTYSDPYTVVPAVLTAGASGYFQMRGAKVPEQTKFTGNSAVVTDSTVSRGAVSGTARVVGSAESSYRYGPFKVFKRTEVVPAQGSVSFSGLRSPGRGQNYLVNVEGVATATVKGKPVFADVSYRGNYGARSGRTILNNAQTGEYFVSQSGRGKAVGVLGTERTSPGSSAVFVPDRATGNLVVSQTTRGRGFADGGTVNRYGFSKGSQGFTRDFPVYVEQRGGLSPRGSQFAGSAEQGIKAMGQQGFSLRSADLAFRDLQRQGLYSPRVVEPRPTFGQRVESLRQSRRGSYQMGSQELMFEPPSVRVRQLPQSTVMAPKMPSLGGLPLGVVKGRQVPSYASAALFGVRSRSRVDQVVDQSSAFGFSRAFPQRISQSPLTSYRPAQVQAIVPRQLPGVRQDPVYDVVPRYDTIPRQDTVPRTIPITPFPIEFQPKPPPELPGGGFGFPGFPIPPGQSSSERGRASRSFQYAPSLTAQFFNIRGNAPKGQLSGFEIRPIADAPRKRKRRQR